MPRRVVLPQLNDNPSALIGPMFAMFGISGAIHAQPIRFDEPIVYDDLQYVRAIATGDFSRDARMDVAFPAPATDRVQIYLNDGNGGLIPGSSVQYTSNCYFLSACDVDDDGADDLIWTDYFAGSDYTISVWFNDGSGNFVEHVTALVEERPRVRMAVGDIDDDGDVDILHRVTDSPTLSAFVNVGGRAFERRELYTYPDANYQPQGAAIGDFDLDGDTDIAVLYQDAEYGEYDLKVRDTQLVLLTNDGAGHFEFESQSQFHWGNGNDLLARTLVGDDFDGDGDMDVAMAAYDRWEYDDPVEIIVAENHSADHIFTSAQVIQLGIFEPLDLRSGDFDVDGGIDLALICSPVWGIYALQNTRSEPDWFDPVGTSPAGVGYLDAMAIGDVTPDGFLDLLAAGDGGFSVLSNISTFDGPILDVTPLVRDETARFGVARAQPGDRAFFLYSLEGTGNSPGVDALGGLTLDLRGPFQVLGSRVADANGRAALRIRIPANAPLVPVAFQAVIPRGIGGADSVKTPFQTVKIDD